MTTERRGLFVFRTDDTGTKCAAECPHVHIEYATTIHDAEDGCDYDDEQWFCGVFGGETLEPEHFTHEREDGSIDETFIGWTRHPKCIASETAAREAEVDALQRIKDEVLTERYETPNGVRYVVTLAALKVGDEIERIRRGES